MSAIVDPLAQQESPAPKVSGRKPKRVDGWVGVPHNSIPGLAWICGEPRMFVLLTILSLINTREGGVPGLLGFRGKAPVPRKGPNPAVSGVLIALTELADLAHGAMDLRTIQRAFSYLISIGAVTVLDWKAAAQKGLLTPEEVKKAHNGFLFVTVEITHFESIARRLQKEAKEAAESETNQNDTEGPEATAEETKRPGRQTYRLTPKPIVFRPGAKPEKIKLDDGAQNALALVEAIQPKYTGSAHLLIDLKAVEGVLQLSVADAPNLSAVTTPIKSEEKAKHDDKFVARHHTSVDIKGFSEQCTLADPIRQSLDFLIFDKFGRHLDDKIAAHIAARFPFELQRKYGENLVRAVDADLARGKLSSPAGIVPIAKWVAASIAKGAHRNGNSYQGGPPASEKSRAALSMLKRLWGEE